SVTMTTAAKRGAPTSERTAYLRSRNTPPTVGFDGCRGERVGHAAANTENQGRLVPKSSATRTDIDPRVSRKSSIFLTDAFCVSCVPWFTTQLTHANTAFNGRESTADLGQRVSRVSHRDLIRSVVVSSNRAIVNWLWPGDAALDNVGRKPVDRNDLR